VKQGDYEKAGREGLNTLSGIVGTAGVALGGAELATGALKAVTATGASGAAVAPEATLAPKPPVVADVPEATPRPAPSRAAATGAEKGFHEGVRTDAKVTGKPVAERVMRKGATSGEIADTVKRVRSRTWRGSEKMTEGPWIHEGGSAQQSFFQGHAVKRGVKGSTVPDVYAREHQLAIEVKNYDIGTSKGQNDLVRAVVKGADKRAAHLPKGAQQALVLDVGGQQIDAHVMQKIINRIEAKTPHFGNRWWIYFD